MILVYLVGDFREGIKLPRSGLVRRDLWKKTEAYILQPSPVVGVEKEE